MIKAASRLIAIEASKDKENWGPGIRGYHQAVGALVLALDTGNFSFQLRGPHSDTPNCYGTWGGSVDGAEDLVNALRRELREETGYNGEWSVMPLKVSRNGKGFEYHTYFVTVPKQFVVNPESEFRSESTAAIWTAFNQWPQPMHPGLKAVLDDPHVQFVLEQALKRRAQNLSTGVKVNAASRLVNSELSIR